MKPHRWKRRRRLSSGRALAAIGVPPSRLRTVDVLRESVLSVTRSPARTFLTATATALGVAAMTSVVGLSATARASVSDSFDVLRATVVTFTEEGAPTDRPLLTLDSEPVLRHLNGVVGAGLVWQVDQGRPQPVRRSVAQDRAAPSTARLVVHAVSAAALTTMGVRIREGRVYDGGMERRRTRVALIGREAATELGLTGVDRAPVVYLGDTPVTIIGIIEDTPLDTEVLTALVIPTTTAEDLGLRGQRELLVRTAPGAAQVIAGQGPYALTPLSPALVGARTPPDPTQLHHQVDRSLASMLGALALVALAIGMVAIGNTTLLAVIQRRPEIGLRRALGAAPRHIAALILTEAASVGTIGGVLGTSLGVMIIAVASALQGWAPVLDPAISLGAPLVGTLAGALAGIVPARKASRITPLDALQR